MCLAIVSSWHQAEPSVAAASVFYCFANSVAHYTSLCLEYNCCSVP